MRKLPRPGPALFNDPAKVCPDAVGWSMSSHVYPDTLAVQVVESPHPVPPPDGAPGTMIRAVYDVIGVARVSTYLAHRADGERLCGSDTIELVRRVWSPVTEFVAMTIAADLCPPDVAGAMEEALRTVMQETVRAIMCGWHSHFPGCHPAPDDAVIDGMKANFRWSDQHLLPVVSKILNIDLRAITVNPAL